jgi:hypothetical protein
MQGYGPGGYPQPHAAPPAHQAYAAAPAAGGYEFSPEQDKRLASLGSQLIFSGIIQIVWGLGQGTTSWVFGLGQWLYNAPISIALLIIGIMMCLAGSSFKRIRTTQGSDIQHLMDAVGKLSIATIIQIVGFMLAMLLGALVLFLVFVVGVIAVAAS